MLFVPGSESGYISKNEMLVKITRYCSGLLWWNKVSVASYRCVSNATRQSV